jgi:hypothetical protein
MAQTARHRPRPAHRRGHRPEIVDRNTFASVRVRAARPAELAAALIRRMAGATTALSLALLGGAMFGHFEPAGMLSATAIHTAVTVDRSAGLLAPLPALAVLAGYAAVALGVAMISVAVQDA